MKGLRDVSAALLLLALLPWGLSRRLPPPPAIPFRPAQSPLGRIEIEDVGFTLRGAGENLVHVRGELVHLEASGRGVLFSTGKVLACRNARVEDPGGQGRAYRFGRLDLSATAPGGGWSFSDGASVFFPGMGEFPLSGRAGTLVIGPERLELTFTR